MNNKENKKPILLVFAGPNGSGKSTIKPLFELQGQYTNADDIVAATGMNNLDAAKLADKMRYDAISNGNDLTFETVLSSEYKMAILRKAKEEGYFIKCVFVLTIDPQLNVLRIATRVAKGGHDVEEGKVISRYQKSLNNVKELMNLCDILHIYDNTDKMTRIVRKHKKDITIFPNEYWDEKKILSLIQ